MANSVLDSEGRIWIPADLLRRLGVCGPMAADVQERGGELVITLAEGVAKEDEWAYTPERRAATARALHQVRAGDVRQLAEADLIASVNGDVARD